MTARNDQTIGVWSEIKLAILREYATAYSRILVSQRSPSLEHVYIDAFAGSGVHQTRAEGDLVWGSPTSALLIDPPFREYHLIDLDCGNIDLLRMQVESRTQGPYDPEHVHLYNADCNEILVEKVFPRVRYEDYRRGLCLLDPYGLHLDWRVVQAAGQMGTIEIFLNFPTADMNRNVLRRDPSNVHPAQVERMNRFWGDNSWREAAYTRQSNLFGFEEKTNNERIVQAFRQRLRTVGGFSYVPEPIPMKNSTQSTVYYLFFAAQKPVAADIVTDIFNKYRR